MDGTRRNFLSSVPMSVPSQQNTKCGRCYLHRVSKGLLVVTGREIDSYDNGQKNVKIPL